MAKPTLPPSLNPDLLERLRAGFASFPLIEGWGVEIQELAPGRARMGLKAVPRTTNPDGLRVNGGIQATFADMACALALATAFDGAMPFVTSDLHIRYLEPAAGDVVAEAELLRLSGRSAVVACHLRVGGELVALCTCQFAVKLPPRP